MDRAWGGFGEGEGPEAPDDDKIELEIIVNDDISEDKIAILANNKLESPKNIFTMFCTDNCRNILKGFLEKSVDWSVKTEFAVS